MGTINVSIGRNYDRSWYANLKFVLEASLDIDEIIDFFVDVVYFLYFLEQRTTRLNRCS